MEANLQCVRCDYDLRTLDRSGSCPECGLAIAESARGHWLRFQPACLRRLRIGAALTAVGLMLILAAWAAMYRGKWSPEWISKVILGTVIAALLCIAAGVWLLTSRTGESPQSRRSGRRLRWLTRLTLVLVLVWIISWMGLVIVASVRVLARWDAVLTVASITLLVLGMLFGLTWWCRLVMQLPSRRLRTHFRILRLGVLGVGGPLAAVMVLSRLLIIFAWPPPGFPSSLLHGGTAGSTSAIARLGWDVLHAVQPWVLWLLIAVYVLLVYLAAVMVGLFVRLTREARLARQTQLTPTAEEDIASNDPGGFWPFRWTWQRLTLVVLLGAMIYVGYWIDYPVWQRERLASTISSYGWTASQADADVLTTALDQQKLAPAMGDLALRAMATPKVYQRSTYAVGEEVTIALAWPHPARFEHLRIVDAPFELWAHGQRVSGAPWSGAYSDADLFQRNRILRLRYIWGSPWPQHPGTYDAMLVLRYELENKKTHQRAYSTMIRIPLHLHVVSAAQAERVKTVSNPKLDKAMQAAFSSKPVRSTGVTNFSGGSRQGTWQGEVQITSQPLPMAIWMKAYFEDNSGKRFPMDWQIAAHRGEDALASISYFAFEEHLPPPGTYHGYVVLTPDPKHAYNDPTYKTIWGGTLRFPYTFTIR